MGWFKKHFPTKKKMIIRGCEQRGDKDSVYMVRTTLIEFENWQLCKHVFHRSDADEYHDHPWNFITLMLSGGYIEHIREPRGNGAHFRMAFLKPWHWAFRKAEHQHHVQLFKDGLTGTGYPHTQFKERKAVTLVLMFKKRREWGFIFGSKWIPWHQYFAEKGC